MSCPFCEIIEDETREIIWEDEHAFAIRDKFPISPGHTLIIPRRHIGTLWECTPEEGASLFSGSQWVKDDLEITFSRIDGWNIGVNVGEAAGQTVFHVHMHVVPRFIGDVDNPIGGVRHVVPDKADYHSA